MQKRHHSYCTVINYSCVASFVPCSVHWQWVQRMFGSLFDRTTQQLEFHRTHTPCTLNTVCAVLRVQYCNINALLLCWGWLTIPHHTPNIRPMDLVKSWRHTSMSKEMRVALDLEWTGSRLSYSRHLSEKGKYHENLSWKLHDRQDAKQPIFCDIHV